MSSNRSALNPSAPVTPVRNVGSRYLISSPYSGKSPLPMPILLPSQYTSGHRDARMSDIGTSKKLVNTDLISEKSIIRDNYTSFGSDELDMNEKREPKIDLFEKISIKQDSIDIPEVGSSLKDFPFFDSSKSTRFLSSYNSITRQSIELRKINDKIVDFNESLGAYLFGLFQNAWCVNFNETLNSESIQKLSEMVELQKQVSDLEKQLETIKNRALFREQAQHQRRRSLQRQNEQQNKTQNEERRTNFQRQQQQQQQQQQQSQSQKHTYGSFTKPVVPRKRKSLYEPKNSIQPVTKARSFLKAGSRNATFKSRSNRSNNEGSDSMTHYSNRRPFTTDLNLNYATKISTADNDYDSSSSVSDTSEIQTLSSIRGVPSGDLRRKFPGASGRVSTFRTSPTASKNGSRGSSWEVRHGKPFR